MKTKHENRWQAGIGSHTGPVPDWRIDYQEKKSGERKLYQKKFKQAPWAPPAWAFGPAWMINNYFLSEALKEIITDKSLKNRNALLGIQSAIWAIYFSFGYVYFKKESPKLAALWTLSDTALAALSIYLLHKNKSKLTKKYLPLLAWTSFASTVAIYQAVKNKDPLIDK